MSQRSLGHFRPMRGGAPASRQRVQRLGQRQPHGQRQAGPVLRRQRQRQREGQRSAGAGRPAAPQAAAAARLLLRPPAGRAARRRCGGHAAVRSSSPQRVQLTGPRDGRVALAADGARALEQHACWSTPHAPAPPRCSPGSSGSRRCHSASAPQCRCGARHGAQRFLPSMVRAAARAAAAAFVLLLQLGRVALVDDQAVVVEQLLARG